MKGLQAANHCLPGVALALSAFILSACATTATGPTAMAVGTADAGEMKTGYGHVRRFPAS